MSKQAHRAAEWVYRGIWGVLTGLFKVPASAPSLPVASGARHESFQPGEGYLRYLKFQFWVILVVIDVALSIAWLIVTVVLLHQELPVIAALIALPFLFVIVVPDIIAYIAIHLRYDTMWYVLTDRSLRIRRGLWIIHEITITFENVQNVTVQQGPVQRWFGIASVVVDTAGGGGGGGGKHDHNAGMMHRGILEGIGNAQEIRDLILSRVRASTSAGLGDEHHGVRDGAHAGGAHAGSARGTGFTAEHIEALRGIRDQLRTLALR